MWLYTYYYSSVQNIEVIGEEKSLLKNDSRPAAAVTVTSTDWMRYRAAPPLHLITYRLMISPAFTTMTFRGRIHKKYWLCNAPPSKFDNLAVAMLSRPHQMCPKGLTQRLCLKYGRGPKLEGCAFANSGNSSEAKTWPRLAPPTPPAAFPSPRLHLPPPSPRPNLCHSSCASPAPPTPRPPRLHLAHPAYISPAPLPPHLHIARPTYNSPAPPTTRPSLVPIFPTIVNHNCHHLHYHHHLLIVGCIFSLLVGAVNFLQFQ